MEKDKLRKIICEMSMLLAFSIGNQKYRLHPESAKIYQNNLLSSFQKKKRHKSHLSLIRDTQKNKSPYLLTHKCNLNF